MDRNNSPRRGLRRLLGRALDPGQASTFSHISLVAFFAWVGLGSDGLSSTAYGPEEAFVALGKHTHLGLLVAIATAATVLIISASYMQIIASFPSGGGGYLVASKLLSPRWGMLSGCALLIDYILTVTISAASAADAVASFLPPYWQGEKLNLAYFILAVLVFLNLRGAKESILPLVPVFLLFILTHGFAIAYVFAVHLMDFGATAAETLHEAAATHSELGLWGMVFLLMRSYSMGAGTYTGIEAVSNGLPILREPRVQTARRTMVYMAVSLAVTVFGLMTAYLLQGISREPGLTLNASLFKSITADWPGGSGRAFVTTTLASEALILFAAAQAGFLGGPRVLANMALDRWFPTRFAMLSDRLVTQNALLIMGAVAFLTLALTRGSVQYLVVLYSITVFISFVLTQAGMVRHWLAAGRSVVGRRRRLIINGTGLVLCGFILISMTILKFHQGGWITLLCTGALVGVAMVIRQDYAKVEKSVKKLDTLMVAARLARELAEKGLRPPPLPGVSESGLHEAYNPKAKTAVLVINGYNGLGLHSLFAVLRMLGSVFRNFVFLEVGVLDAGNFKGVDEVENLRAHVDQELGEYVRFVESHGYHAEAVGVLSHDAVDGAANAAPGILQRYPQAIFFMGQLVFEEETLWTRLLYNNLVFALQRRLYHAGIPFIILPVRIKGVKGGRVAE